MQLRYRFVASLWVSCNVKCDDKKPQTCLGRFTHSKPVQCMAFGRK